VFFADDVTPEKIASYLEEQDGRLLIASAEGTVFEIVKGRYSEAANFDVFLKGHSGDPLRVGRVWRKGEFVEQPALSLALAVQPDVIRGLATNASLRGRGFLARLLYSIPTSKVGTRTIAPAPTSPEAEEEYYEAVQAVWCVAAPPDEGLSLTAGKVRVHWLTFGPEADRLMREFENYLEPQLAEGAELFHLAGWANKLAGACARIAGILHVAKLIAEGKDWCNTPISGDTAAGAIALGRDYLLPHAQAAFVEMGADERLESARRVWESIVRRLGSADAAHSAHGGPCVSRRDLLNWNRRAFPSVEQLDPVIEYLCGTYYLRPIEDPTRQPGRGHKSPTYEVNPLALAEPGPPVRTERTERTESTEEDSLGDAWEG
jgi:hypothetical protein